MTRRYAAVAGGVAAIALAIGAWLYPRHAVIAYLWAYQFWLGCSLGALAVLMVHHLVGGGWGSVIRRPLEAALGVLPWLAVAFLPLAAGLPMFYATAHGHQAAYLATPLFLLRAVIYFAVWLGLAWRLLSLSDAQDRDGDAIWKDRLSATSAAGMVLYGLTTFFASVDWIMALEPGWYSTTFGLIWVAGHFTCGFALGIVVAAYVTREARDQHFNDLGNLLLACVMTWAYVSYAQYLVIWSGNLRADNAWYVHRSHGGWLPIIVFVVALHFALPFVMLLFRGVKRQRRALAGVALLLLFAQAVHGFWQLTPVVSPTAMVSWLDLAAPVALGGLWLWVYMGKLAQRPLVPLHDERMRETPDHAYGA